MKESNIESKYLKFAFHHITEGVSINSKDGKILWFNRSLINIFRVHEDDISGRNCRDLISFKDKQPEECPHHQVLKTGKSSQKRCYIESLGKWIEVRCHPVLGQDGQITHIIHIYVEVPGEDVGIVENRMLKEVWGTQRDVTHQIDLVEKLKESEGTIGSILESISDIVFAFDPEKRLLFFHAPGKKVSSFV